MTNYEVVGCKASGILLLREATTKNGALIEMSFRAVLSCKANSASACSIFWILDEAGFNLDNMVYYSESYIFHNSLKSYLSSKKNRPTPKLIVNIDKNEELDDESNKMVEPMDDKERARIEIEIQERYTGVSHAIETDDDRWERSLSSNYDNEKHDYVSDEEGFTSDYLLNQLNDTQYENRQDEYSVPLQSLPNKVPALPIVIRSVEVRSTSSELVISVELPTLKNGPLLLTAFKLVLFDLDDTLVSTRHLEGLRLALAKDPANLESLLRLLDTQKLRTYFSTEWLIELKRLAPGLKIGVLTRSPRSYATAVLEHAYPGIQFDILVAREDAPIKPNPDGVFHAMRQLAIHLPSEVVLVGDDTTDIMAGYAAGCYTVLAYLKSEPRKPRDWYWAHNLLPDAEIERANALLDVLEHPQTFLPLLESFGQDSGCQVGKRLNLQIRSVSKFEGKLTRTPIPIQVLGRSFVHDWGISDHKLTSEIYAKLRDAFTVFPDWILALKAYLIHLSPQNRPDIITVIPRKPEKARRLELVLEALKHEMQGVSGFEKCVFIEDLLCFREGVRSSKSLNQEERRANTATALYLNPAYVSTLQGKSVLVIDDVVTSGATLLCARAELFQTTRRFPTLLALSISIGVDKKYGLRRQTFSVTPNAPRFNPIHNENLDLPAFTIPKPSPIKLIPRVPIPALEYPDLNIKSAKEEPAAKFWTSSSTDPTLRQAQERFAARRADLPFKPDVPSPPVQKATSTHAPPSSTTTPTRAVPIQVELVNSTLSPSPSVRPSVDSTQPLAPVKAPQPHIPLGRAAHEQPFESAHPSKLAPPDPPQDLWAKVKSFFGMKLKG